MELDSKLKVNPVISETSTIDSLPVVEIRPFTRQVWRRERSFAEFYNKPPETNQNAEQRYYPGENLPNIVEVLADITQSSNKVEDDKKRTKTITHPKMPSINVSASYSSPSIIASFITKGDRTKTTLFLSQQEENPKSYSCRKQALNSATVRRHQQMKLDGDPLNLPEELPNRFVYLNPLNYYKQRAMKHKKYRQSHHSSAPSDDRIKDISSLPGREIGIIGIQRKRSAAKPRLRPLSATKRESSVHGLKSDGMGKDIKQALVFPESKSTIIEQQLEIDRSFHLQRCRRNMDIGYTSLELLQHLQNETGFSRSLTQGELAIQQGKVKNKTKSKGEKSTKSLAPVVQMTRRRGKILSIRKLGPDPIVQSTGKSKNILETKESIKETIPEGMDINSNGSDVSMVSENGEKPMSGTGSENSSGSMESNECEEKELFRGKENDDQLLIDTPTMNTPAKESHTQSPLIEMVARVNSDHTSSLLRTTSAVTESGNDSIGSVDSPAAPKHSESVSSELLETKDTVLLPELPRRPKACAYDAESCKKHNSETEKNVSDIKKNVANDSENNDFAPFGNKDRTGSSETPGVGPELESSEDKPLNMCDNDSQLSDFNINSTGETKHNIKLRGDNVDNNLGDFTKRIDDIEDPLIKDQQTQNDSVIDSVDLTEDPLLPSNTFLTTNV
ncbi:hypothetical protein LOTGIDRAFT_154199 [Lottia gigantea]|uniref:Uncharacterized protein n=1 Tax=Lottia gigantea TaxID=225164 RepID=V4A757_LOTGI|nr:hypothetical protein LOTGIDRAFT_154199 [Lottia gigantea]ESO89116.1 hypothetical protein LOTGIDRAFT_154199 [Lottia gigantea]